MGAGEGKKRECPYEMRLSEGVQLSSRLHEAPGQRNIKSYYKVINWLYPILIVLFPNQGSTMSEVGLAMIDSVLKGYPKQVLEIKDIKSLAKV